MPNMMFMEMGLNVVNAIGKHQIASEQYKMDKASRKYQETMTALSAAQSNNAINMQEYSLRDANAQSDVDLQAQSLQEKADFDVEAAASGIMGNTITVGRRALGANFARARHNQQRQFKAASQDIADARKRLELEVIYGKDTSPLKKPSLGASLLGAATGMFDTYKAHRPQGV